MLPGRFVAHVPVNAGEGRLLLQGMREKAGSLVKHLQNDGIGRALSFDAMIAIEW